MSINIGDKVLITTDRWFFAPDGQSYMAVHGTVRAVKSDAETLGIKTNARSTNWYIEVGNTTIAGCQIHYAIKSDTCNFGEALGETGEGEHFRQVMRACRIYNADQVAS